MNWNEGYLRDLSGHPVGCIGADIKHCQFKGFGGHYSLPTKQFGAGPLRLRWNAYFGDAWLHGGVDFFV